MSERQDENAKITYAPDAVLRMVRSLISDNQVADRHVRTTPIRVLGGRTIAEALKDGDAIKVLRYLRTISGGQNG